MIFLLGMGDPISFGGGAVRLQCTSISDAESERWMHSGRVGRLVCAGLERVDKGAEPWNADLHAIPRLERTNAGRRPGENQIARLKGNGC
jgi:hypothetical protein